MYCIRLLSFAQEEVMQLLLTDHVATDTGFLFSPSAPRHVSSLSLHLSFLHLVCTLFLCAAGTQPEST